MTGPDLDRTFALVPTHTRVKDKRKLLELSERTLCAMLAGRLETQTNIDAPAWAHAAVELAACLLVELGE